MTWFLWREEESNLRPSGYEPDELPLLYPAISKNVFLFSAGWRRFAKFLGFPRSFNSVRSYVVHQTQIYMVKTKTAYKQYIFLGGTYGTRTRELHSDSVEW